MVALLLQGAVCSLRFGFWRGAFRTAASVLPGSMWCRITLMGAEQKEERRAPVSSWQLITMFCIYIYINRI